MPERLFFPDNTVLTNFAILHKMDLLQVLAQGRGQWVATVQTECMDGAAKPGLEDMAKAAAIFGVSLVPDRAERTDTFSFQAKMLMPGDDPHRSHLGEAETVAIISRRGLSGVFVTDDTGAKKLAKEMGDLGADHLAPAQARVPGRQARALRGPGRAPHAYRPSPRIPTLPVRRARFRALDQDALMR